jgi:hypothetical protein
MTELLSQYGQLLYEKYPVSGLGQDAVLRAEKCMARVFASQEVSEGRPSLDSSSPASTPKASSTTARLAGARGSNDSQSSQHQAPPRYVGRRCSWQIVGFTCVPHTTISLTALVCREEGT